MSILRPLRQEIMQAIDDKVPLARARCHKPTSRVSNPGACNGWRVGCQDNTPSSQLSLCLHVRNFKSAACDTQCSAAAPKMMRVLPKLCKGLARGWTKVEAGPLTETAAIHTALLHCTQKQECRRKRGLSVRSLQWLQASSRFSSLLCRWNEAESRSS